MVVEPAKNSPNAQVVAVNGGYAQTMRRVGGFAKFPPPPPGAHESEGRRALSCPRGLGRKIMDARQGSQTGGFENGRAKDLGSRALSTEAKVTISRQDKTGYRWLGVWVLR